METTKISTDEVAYVANLARLSFDEEETGRFTSQLNAILRYMDTLQEVDTTGVEPMTSAVEVTLPMRDDVVTDGGYAPKIVANATEPVSVGEGAFFTVPKVVE